MVAPRLLHFMFKTKLFIVLFTLLALLSSTILLGKQMENTYYTWDDFVENFGGQMESADRVFENMTDAGLKPQSLLQFDVHFVTDTKQKIETLHQYITSHYLYTLEPIKQREDKLWELTGQTNPFPVTADNLLFWALDMYKLGYEFDSELDGYGAPHDPKKQTFPELSKEKEDEYFNRGLERYNANDLSGAIINWSNVIEINSQDANAYYSRAIVKNELYTWRAALSDYDKAIEIAPDFISALINRGSLRDENNDYQGAIEDYNAVITNKKASNEILQQAYANRGNTYLNLENNQQACIDWKKAASLGADYVAERIKKHCET
jgi:tetratricopeptide (TPR) repeat protein